MEFVYSRMVCSFSDSMIVNSYRFNEYFSYAFNTCLALGAPACVWVFESSTSLLSTLLECSIHVEPNLVSSYCDYYTAGQALVTIIVRYLQ